MYLISPVFQRVDVVLEEISTAPAAFSFSVPYL
jgi:hypothetical protein